MRSYFVVQSFLEHPDFVVKALDIVLHQRITLLLHLQGVVSGSRGWQDFIGHAVGHIVVRLVQVLRHTRLVFHF